MSLPYPVADDYQFVKGNFEHNGEYYKLVKQKLEGDTLYVVCTIDKKAKNIAATMIEYGNLSNDLPSQTKGSQLLLSKIIKEYTRETKLTSAMLLGLKSETLESPYIIYFDQADRSVQSPPPWL